MFTVESVQEFFTIFHQDLIDAKVNFLAPFVGYLGCHTVHALTDSLDPVTALAVGILMTLTDYLCGAISTGCDTEGYSLNSSSFGMMSKMIIPLAVIAAAGTPITTGLVYLTINIAARVLVGYCVAT